MSRVIAILRKLLGLDPKPVPVPPPPPVWIEATVLRVYYGVDKVQQFIDLYIPAHWSDVLVPVVFMFHGGGWKRGDADADNVVANKWPWLNALGICLASVSYRLGVDSTPVVAVWTEAEDCATAVGWLRANGAKYGLDTSRMGGMGHSAGCHLGSLIQTHPDLLAISGKLLFYVAIDSAAWNVVDLFNGRVAPDQLYVQAFDNHDDPPHFGPDYQRECSPLLQPLWPLPVYVIHSLQRGPQAKQQAQKAYDAFYALDKRTKFAPVDKSHGALNADLGDKSTPENAAYTEGAEAFILANIG